MYCHFLNDEFVPRHAKHCLASCITKLMKHCRISSKGEMRQCITSIRCYIPNIVDKLPFHMDIISQSTLFMDHRVCYTSLQWRHNEPDGVSNHQPHDSLLNLLFRRWSNKTSKLRVTGLWRGIHWLPVISSRKGPITRKMLPFDDVIMSYTVCWREQIKWTPFLLIITP